MQPKRTILVAFFIVLSVAFPLTFLTELSAAEGPSGTFSLVQSGTFNVSSITVGPSPINSTVLMDLRIDNASNIWAWTISVNWTSSVLQLKKVKEGSFLKSDGGSTIFIGGDSMLFDNEGGTISGGILDTRTDASAINTTSGVLATLTFNVTGFGKSSIILSEGYLKDAHLAGNPAAIRNYTGVSALTKNAVITVVAQTSNSNASSSTHSPTASFYPLEGTIFNIGDTVNLDASTSTPGYIEGNETANNAETCPITNYAWRVEYSNGTFLSSFSGQKASFTANVGGPLRIILIVTAPDQNPIPDPNYVPTDSHSAYIHVGPLQNVTNIDLYTERGGIGQDVNCDSYAPQELIRIYAYATYRDTAVVNEDIAFSIKDSAGSEVGLRVARTNASGIAYADYRLPSPVSNKGEVSFGTWSISASASVSQITLNDTVQFIFRYLAAISNIQAPANVHRLDTFLIQFTVNDFSNLTPWHELAITLFDEAKVPIGSYTYINNHQMQNVAVVDVTIPIPSWAFEGQATAYVCLLAENGGGLVPESSVPFQILA